MSLEVDRLTGLGSLRALEDNLSDLLTGNSTVSLAVLDLDNFMEINDEFGTETGDHVLKTLAGLLSEEAGDATYRISGDEFAIVMPDLTLEQAFLRMEALRANVEAAADRFGLPKGRGVTVTVGVAQFPRDADDGRTLLQAATAAMASAKEKRKNHVALPMNEEMVMKSCYYPAPSLRKLKTLAERVSRSESRLLREALDDLLRKYDRIG
jgi:diguanylate cyclase (GGDEF)-like protein